VHLALPYEKGNIEGSIFVYDSIAYIWDIEIFLWFAKTAIMLTKFHSIKKESNIFNVIWYQKNIGHFHFEGPLQQI
jgi:hypothetical protein